MTHGKAAEHSEREVLESVISHIGSKRCPFEDRRFADVLGAPPPALARLADATLITPGIGVYRGPVVARFPLTVGGYATGGSRGAAR